jgi:hypothetical protein
MSEADMPIVTLYLKHFESLYPELIASVAAAHEIALKKPSFGSKKPPGINFWPRNTDVVVLPLVFVISVKKQWTFLQSAGLFGRLEAAGWDRRVLWTFLRDKVERSKTILWSGSCSGGISGSRSRASVDSFVSINTFSDVGWV